VAPKLLVEKPQWLVWKFESQPGDKKPRKVPYYAGGARRTGEQGSDDDRAQLVSYATAQASRPPAAIAASALRSCRATG
jgi:putative DNA primase/helicase